MPLHAAVCHLEPQHDSILLMQPSMLFCLPSCDMQADLPLMLPPASLGTNIFADWPFGSRSWPWRGSFNVGKMS
jgi:hypothetical protein